MRISELASILIASVLVLGMATCTMPNLAVDPIDNFEGPDIESFCRIVEGEFVVVIKSNGNEDAPASSTTVTFTWQSGNRTVTLATPSIPSASTTALTTAIPEACFDPDCDLEILVDAFDEIDETTEMDNIEPVLCRQ